MLENEDITPGEFLHRASWCTIAAVRHGLRIGVADADSSDSTDSSEDSDSNISDN